MQLNHGYSRCSNGDEILVHILFMSALDLFIRSNHCASPAVSETGRMSKVGIDMCNVRTNEVNTNLRRDVVVNTRAWYSGGRRVACCVR
jgi:hypothetical protein